MKVKEEVVHSKYPDGTEDVLNTNDIIVSKEFKRTRIGFNKLRWAVEYYERNGQFDKPISIRRSDKLLLDEYSRLVAAQILDIPLVGVKYIY